MSRVVVVSNRMPNVDRDEPAPGGLLSALQPVIAAADGALWLGWDGSVSDTRSTTRTRLGATQFVSISLNDAEFHGYYERFSNAVLWPAMHGAVDRLGASDAEDYETYLSVNDRFAEALMRELSDDDLVWVHDYHLVPLGRSLRDQGFNGRIGYFHHVPFPAAETWALVPDGEDLARAFGSYDLIGVQTASDQEHVRSVIGPETSASVEVFPISIDPEEVRAELSPAAVCGGAVLDDCDDRGLTFFGVDRLDYTKGIPQRLEAYRRVLERRPSMRSVRFVQWAAPSREALAEYQAERIAIDEAAEALRREYAASLELSYEQRPRAAVLDALARADVCVVNSMADGMNLVAKEFAAVHSAARPGVLILSDACGAAHELTSSLIVRAGDVDDLADALEEAYDMPRAERARRSAELRAQVDAHTSADWADDFIASLQTSHRAVESAVVSGTPSLALATRSGRFEAELEDRAEERLRILETEDTMARFWARDLDLWSGDAEDRLGWLDLDHRMEREIPRLAAFAGDVLRSGITSALLLGMGGSAMAPRVFAQASNDNGLPLHVLDSTVPAAIRAAEVVLDPERTLFVVSSKSGSTAETLHLLEYFWERHPDGRRFVAITDPGTRLHEIALERGFRDVFLNPSDIGGRFSALSFSGLVAASLAGSDLEALLRGARDMREACGPYVATRANPGARLGATLAEAAFMGRDVLALVGERERAPLRAWVEQLVAESTGKAGGGLLPVFHSPHHLDGGYGAQNDLLDERVLRMIAGGSLDPRTPQQLGGEYVRWEVGVALAGSILGLNPFDQPDVESTKAATRLCLDQGIGGEASVAAGDLFVPDGPDGYVSIQAYLSGSEEERVRLGRLRDRVQSACGVPTMLEYGPSFLHSTGQYHKAGRRRGAFIQVLSGAEEPLAVPSESYTFEDFVHAQACADSSVLQDRGGLVVTGTLAELETQL